MGGIASNCRYLKTGNRKTQEKRKKKPMSNVISFQKEEANRQWTQTNKRKWQKRKIVATRARIDVNCAAHARAVLALERF